MGALKLPCRVFKFIENVSMMMTATSTSQKKDCQWRHLPLQLQVAIVRRAVFKEAEALNDIPGVTHIAEIATFGALWRTSRDMQRAIRLASKDICSLTFLKDPNRSDDDNSRVGRDIIEVCASEIYFLHVAPAFMLSNGLDVTLQAVAACSHLQFISLKHCIKLTSAMLEDFASCCDRMSLVPRFRSLDIRACEKITDGGFLEYDCMQFLENLNVAWCRSFNPSVGWLASRKRCSKKKLRSSTIEQYYGPYADGIDRINCIFDGMKDGEDNDNGDDGGGVKSSVSSCGLKQLNAAGCAALDLEEMTRSPESIQGMEVLNLAFVVHVTDDVLRGIARMPNMKKLLLSGPSNNTWEWGFFTSEGLRSVDERGIEIELLIVP